MWLLIRKLISLLKVITPVYANDLDLTVITSSGGTFNSLQDGEDNSIDFIYFDGFAHTGQDYGKTLIKWSKKIKHNGILSGDDYDDKWELNQQIINQFALDNNFNISLTDVNKKKHIYSSWIIKVDKKIRTKIIKYSKI